MRIQELNFLQPNLIKQSIRMQKAFNEGYCELILDKGNIMYN